MIDLLDEIEEACLVATPQDRAYLQWQLRWTQTARPEQVPPDDGWTEMGVLAGRGFGKTRIGAEWLGRVAYEDSEALPRCVVAPTQNDVRFTCFEGTSGLLNVVPPECVTSYSSGDLLLVLSTGATIRGFSAEKADRLRGPEHADAWLDEVAAWGKDTEYTIDMLSMGLRIGANPRMLWTTTPRPTDMVRSMSKAQPGRIIVRGTTYDNRENLSPKFFDRLAKYEGTRIGRQELYGEVIDPEESGIIKRSWIRLWPNNKRLPDFEMIIMSLDTAFTEKTTDDKTGDPDPTACSVWGLFSEPAPRAGLRPRRAVILLDAWEDFLGLPDLVRRVKKELKCSYGDEQDKAMIKPMFGSSLPRTSGRKVDMLIIEDKGSGISLRQTLAETGILAHAYNPGRADKLARLHIVSPVFAHRRVWVPESGVKPGEFRTWAEPLVGQLCSFAGEGSLRHDDHVDTTSQALRVLMDKGLISLIKEPKEAEPPEEAKRKPYVNPYGV
jgi:predicted phage terminase large subunit-like protein